jgi:hypothetical protein
MSLPNPPEQALTPLGQLEHLLALIHGGEGDYDSAVEKVAKWRAVDASTDTQLILKISECQNILGEVKDSFSHHVESGLFIADIEPKLFQRMQDLLTRIEEEWT